MKKIIFFSICLLLSLYGFSQGRTIKGKVVSDGGSPLIGATITAIKSGTDAITDNHGFFSIPLEGPDSLVVRYIGYTTDYIRVYPGEKLFSITLNTSIGSLNELVVTGYQKEKKKDLTGAVSVVNMANIKNNTTSNPLKALQGHVPGVYVNTDGNPNGSASIQIRGTTTLNDNSPLIIIDGVPTEGGLNGLNTNDIASMQVLKDPSSASIYGSRASNGVIIITTKQGQTGKTQINFSSSLTTEQYTTKLHVLNTEQRGEVLWRAAINDGVDPSTLPIYKYQWHKNNNGVPILDKVIIPKWIDSTNGIESANTNWFNAISRLGLIQNYNLAISTGSQKGTARFSLGYYKNDGIVKENNYKRITAGLNSSYNIIDKVLKIGENISIAGSKEHPMPSGAGGTPLALALIAQPIIPIHTIDGGWGGPSGAGFDDRDNPVRLIEDNKWDYTDILSGIGNAYLDLTLLKNLHFNSSFGVNFSSNYGKSYQKTYRTGFLSNDVTSVSVNQGYDITWNWDNTLDYKLDLGNNNIEALGGIEMLKENGTSFFGYREGFALQTPDYMYLNAGTGNMNVGGAGGGYSLLSYFGKINYSFRDKYLASATLRDDGSSRFGQNNRFALFPAFSLGWRISQENFIKQNFNFLSDLKLRFGWGQTGNQQIDDNAIYSLYIPNYGDDDTWGASNGTAYDISGNGSGTLPAGFFKTQTGDPNLKWETTTGVNYGIDFGFFNQKLSGSFDYYAKNTTNILINPPYAGVLGDGGSQWVNGASLKNHGYEITLEYRNSIGKLNYDITANIGHYKDWITKLPASVALAYAGAGIKSIVGHSPNSLFGYVVKGIFQNQKEVDSSAAQPGKGIGRLRYADLNHDGKIDANDQTFLGVSEPSFMDGLNISLSYKNFDMSIFFQGVQGMRVFNGYTTYTDFTSMWGGANYGTRTLDAWTTQNFKSTIPALTLSDNNDEARSSTYYIQNGSYIKWRTMELGYNFSPGILKIRGIESFHIYVEGENLIIIKNIFNNGATKYTGIDPENPNFAFPRPTGLTFGLNITLL